MSLSPGTRLGPYEIVAPIGAGGMGEVYKARDTRLDRPVALKVIQSSFAASPEMRERFEREARAIAALDHPHICILYDVCREAVPGGASDETVSFLVMQYLEGETLADRLVRAGRPPSDPSRPPSGDSSIVTMSRGPIPFETAMKFAIEIAQALDAAHRRGIVHRDLKPGNVMLTKGGTKLLDFGLAKLAADSAAGTSGEDATRTSPFGWAHGHATGIQGVLTGQGAILGTLYYMSPEQLEGREVDARSDIFSFGALLFEMLAGRRAFESQSQAGVIAAIIGTESPALTAFADGRTKLPIVANRALERLIARCLAKNPEDRWQSAADVAAELQWINDERLRGVEEPPHDPTVVTPSPDPRARRRERIWTAIATTTVVALAVLAVLWFPRATETPDPIYLTIESPDGQGIATGPGLLSVSPDGRRVAFVTGGGDSGQLWVRTLGSPTLQHLDRAAGAWQPFWSPDSRSIAFTGSSRAPSLRRIDLAGGAPITLSDQAGERGTWSQAGVILFKKDNKLYRVGETGGQPTVVLEPDPARSEVSIDWPMFLPDGRRFVFLGRSSDASKTGLFLSSLDSHNRTFLTNAFSSVDYAGGYLFYQRDGTLMAHRFDASRGRVVGDAIPVIEDIRYNNGNGRAAFSVSESGVLAYVAGDDVSNASDRKLMMFDRVGKSPRQIGDASPYMSAALSPDGRQAVVTQDSVQPNAKRYLSVVDIDRGVPTKLTVSDADESNPVWWPDGSSIVFASGRDNAHGIYRRSAGGGATRDELLFSSSEMVVPTSVSFDGRFLLMTRGVAGGQRIWVLPMSGDRKPVEALPGFTTAAGNAVFSPDGKWIVYAAGPGLLESQVYIQSYPTDERRIRISTTSGHSPLWTADGRHIVYRANDDTFWSVELTPTGNTFKPSSPVALFAQRRFGRGNFHFSMDGRAEHFLLVVPPERPSTTSAPPITVIVNWVASLEKRAR